MKRYRWLLLSATMSTLNQRLQMNRHAAVIEYLLSLGADASIKDGEGKTAADYARQNKNEYMCELLMRSF